MATNQFDQSQFIQKLEESLPLGSSVVIASDALADKSYLTITNNSMNVGFDSRKMQANITQEEYETLLKENAQLKQECTWLQKRVHKLEDDAFAAAYS